MKRPKQGQHVWTVYCYEGGYNRKDEIVAKVVEKVFELERKNWCGTDKTKWVLVAPGRPFRHGYGMAYDPEKVYATRQEAEGHLRWQIQLKADRWMNAMQVALRAEEKAEREDRAVAV